MTDELPEFALPVMPEFLDDFADVSGRNVRIWASGDEDARLFAVVDGVDGARFLADYLNAYRGISKELDRLKRAVAIRDANIKELEAELHRLRGGA